MVELERTSNRHDGEREQGKSQRDQEGRRQSLHPSIRCEPPAPIPTEPPRLMCSCSDSRCHPVLRGVTSMLSVPGPLVSCLRPHDVSTCEKDRSLTLPGRIREETSAPATGPRPSLARIALPWLTVGLFWGILFGSSLIAHARNSTKAFLFNGDVRQQIWPLYRFAGLDPFRDDFIARYYRRAFLPLGFQGLYSALGGWLDPATLSKVLPYALLAVVIACLGSVAKRLAGLPALAATGALCFSSTFVLDRLGGGLPRAFAFPILSLALAALASGHVYVLALCIVLGAAFYPPASVVPALALSLWLLVPMADRGQARHWSMARRVMTVAMAGCLSLGLLLPTRLAARTYGTSLSASDAGTYPELGPSGRYDSEDRAQGRGLVSTAIQYALRSFEGVGHPFVPSLRRLARDTSFIRKLIGWIFLASIIGGLAIARRRDEAVRRILLFVVAVPAASILARLIEPRLFLPQRYLQYGNPVIVLALFPACAGILVARLAQWSPRGRAATSVAASALCLIFLGGRVDPRAGLSGRIPVRDRWIYEAVSNLPASALIAGFPGGPIDNVPYVARRRAYLTLETHQAFHEDYVLEMRRRMHALIPAYFGTETTPLLNLRDREGVTHLIVDLADFRDHPPVYFAPFTDEISQAYDDGTRRRFAIPDLVIRLGAPTRGNLALIDLSRIAGGAPSLGAR